MKIIIADDYNAMSRIAALEIKNLIDKKHDSVIGLATGSTPIGTYEELIRMNKNKEIDFSGVKTINLDEYIANVVSAEMRPQLRGRNATDTSVPILLSSILNCLPYMVAP